MHGAKNKAVEPTKTAGTPAASLGDCWRLLGGWRTVRGVRRAGDTRRTVNQSRSVGRSRVRRRTCRPSSAAAHSQPPLWERLRFEVPTVVRSRCPTPGERSLFVTTLARERSGRREIRNNGALQYNERDLKCVASATFPSRARACLFRLFARGGCRSRADLSPY
ncbi:unnamed protein product, partial [Iphiclides podalirius]